MGDRANKPFSGKKPQYINFEAALHSSLMNRVKSFRGENDPTRRKRADSINSLEELVQCAICLEIFSLPRMFPCQHTFCLSCLQGILVSGNADSVPKQRTSMKCPTCKAEVVLENGFDSLEQLPKNMYINSLLSLLASSQEPETPTVNRVDVRCVKCETSCPFEAEKCLHCKQVFCKICWSQHMDDLQAKLQALKADLEASEVRLNHKLDEFDGRCEQLNEAIRQTTEAKIVEIRNKEEAVLKQVEEQKGEEGAIATGLMYKIDKLKSNIAKINFPVIDEQQKVATFMNFHRNTSKLLDEISRWGEKRTIFDSEAFKLDEDTEGLNSEVDESEVINGVRSGANPLESRDSLSIHYKSRSFSAKLFWTKCPKPGGIAVSPWCNNLYIAATDSRVVLILNIQKVKVVGSLSWKDMHCPQAVVCSKNRKEIYVTDKWKHCIHVFSSQGDYLRSLCTKGSGEGKVRSPEGLAITTTDKLIVCDTGNDRVLILEPDFGKQISSIGWHGKRAILNMPTGVAVTEDDLIVVADTGNHRIKMFNINGDQILEFGSLGRGKGQFRSAEIVAVDPLGFIFVGDAGNARIQIFNPDGTLVRVFGGSGQGAGKFKWVSGIAVTSQLDIITTDYKSRSLQIF